MKLSAQQGETEFITITVMNLVTPKAAAKHELLFKKTEAEIGSLKYSSFLAPALGVTKFTIVRDMILVSLCCAT